MSPEKYLQHLRILRQRATLLQPATAEAVIGDLDAMILNAGGDPAISAEERRKQQVESRAAYVELMVQHRNGDAAATAEITTIRQIRLKNLLFARSNVMQFFDTVELGPAEIPEFENETPQRLQVSFIGQDGQAKKAQAQRERARVQVEMHLLSTEEFEYPLKDMYRGNVADESKALVNLSWEIDRKIEALAWPYLTGQIGNFTLTGPNSLRTWFNYNGVNIKNIPTTNLILPSDNGTATTTSPFRKECLDAILSYAASWGDAWQDGAIMPVAIYIASSEAMGFLSQVTLTTQSNILVDQIMQTGYIFDYGGVKWTIIPDSTLDPDPGLAYIRMNKAAGIFFTKPNMDDLIEDLSVAKRRQNKGSLTQVKAVGWGVPNTMKMNVAAVRYHTAR